MEITRAKRSQAAAVASLIMTAMSPDCCRYFAGPNRTLDDFHAVLTALVASDNSQYSFRNTLAATGDGGELLGICVSYDGAQLRTLRQPFIDLMREKCGRDLSKMDDETAPGELYIDSLAVKPEQRGKGIATMLLKATIKKAETMHLPAVGLLVDKGNPRAESLYKKLGFAYENDAVWGGHPMRHLQLKLSIAPVRASGN
ncbi:MAG: GNAT family N-acetyltransferase [Prevotella sp.]|nr:GNAT family N-acetyltransferase [Prevotella sp.]